MSSLNIDQPPARTKRQPKTVGGQHLALERSHQAKRQAAAILEVLAGA
jgi:hypothetical protein